MNVSAEGVEAVAEVVPWEEVSESLEQKRIDYLAAKKKSLRARYIYGILNLVEFAEAIVSVRWEFFAIFLVLQLISVIQFISWWNKYWMPDEQKKHSEPANEECNGQKQGNEGHDWTTVLGFLIAICSIVMATFSTGIDSQSFPFYKDQVREDDDIPYKYGFFHLTFSLGCMYFAMLFISWNLSNSAKKWSIDVGWTSTWVKIVNEWFAASVLLWTLISPAVRQSKVMDREEAVQEIDNSDVP
ncbi:unnamed protein product [Malus baccata var. baccata]